ncbi:hypothetical protein HK096_007273, partial [Nowakowskiella sp. JEL0078]
MRSFTIQALFNIGALVTIIFLLIRGLNSDQKCVCPEVEKALSLSLIEQAHSTFLEQQRQFLLKLQQSTAEFHPQVGSLSSKNIAAGKEGNVYLGDYTIMCHVPYLGHWLFFDSRDKGIMPHMCISSNWEMPITKAFEETVKPGWTVLDI